MAINHRLSGKRILFFLPSLELGGAERQALHLARYLQGFGCDVRVLANSNPGLAAQKCDEAGIPWSLHNSFWPCRKRHWLRFIWRLIGTIVELRRLSPDIIIAYCARPCIAMGLTWRLSPARTFIWSQRDCYITNDRVARLAYRQSSAVICNAEHEITYLKQMLGETRIPTFVVHNGYELAQAKKSRDEWRKKLKVENNALIVTMLANFQTQKDHLTLLKAWCRVLEKVPKGRIQLYLLLAGAPMESFQTVYQRTKNLGLLHSVYFPGQVQDVSGLLAASDVGVLSSRAEGLPNAIIEYMASGLPVVATDTPGTREVLGEEAVQFLCKPGDPNSLAAQLDVLSKDPALRQKIGGRNRKRAETKFSIDRMCKSTVKIINDQFCI